MELYYDDQLMLFQALSEAKGQENSELWEKGAAFCLQHDKQFPTKNGLSELREYLHNTVNSKNSRHHLDLQSLNKWIDAGISAQVLTLKDEQDLHTEVILSQATITQENRSQILSEKGTREQILKQLPPESDNLYFKKVLDEIKSIEQKEELQKLKDRLKKAANEDGTAPSSKQAKQYFSNDPEGLRDLRKRAKEEPKRPVPKKMQKKITKVIKNIFSQNKR